MAGMVMTVRGPIAADQLGFTLPHEHVFIDLVRILPANMLAFDFQLIDEELAIEEVGRFVEHAAGFSRGRPALVDVTRTSGSAVSRSPCDASPRHSTSTSSWAAQTH